MTMKYIGKNYRCETLIFPVSDEYLKMSYLAENSWFGKAVLEHYSDLYITHMDICITSSKYIHIIVVIPGTS